MNLLQEPWCSIVQGYLQRMRKEAGDLCEFLASSRDIFANGCKGIMNYISRAAGDFFPWAGFNQYVFV